MALKPLTCCRSALRRDSSGVIFMASFSLACHWQTFEWKTTTLVVKTNFSVETKVFSFVPRLEPQRDPLVWWQGLLKVAVENARVQDKQIQAEKRELKMELYREREMRESLERQLTSELQSRGLTHVFRRATACLLGPCGDDSGSLS